MSRVKTQVKGYLSKVWLRFITRLIQSLENAETSVLAQWYIFLTNNWILPYYPCAEIRRRVADKKACYSPLEMQVLFNCLHATHTKYNENTTVAEVGVYRGGTARIISDNSDTRRVVLFDTFDGLPEPINGVDSKAFGIGDYTERNVEKVAEYVGDKPLIMQGVFPKTGHEFLNDFCRVYDKFSFVHLDMDLYEGTYVALHFFDRLMVPHGIILVHDYTCSCGVADAVRNFHLESAGRFMFMPVEGGTQAMLICKEN